VIRFDRSFFILESMFWKKLGNVFVSLRYNFIALLYNRLLLSLLLEPSLPASPSEQVANPCFPYGFIEHFLNLTDITSLELVELSVSEKAHSLLTISFSFYDLWKKLRLVNETGH